MEPVQIPASLIHAGGGGGGGASREEEFFETTTRGKTRTGIIWKLELRASPLQQQHQTQTHDDRRRSSDAVTEDLEDFLQDFATEHGQYEQTIK